TYSHIMSPFTPHFRSHALTDSYHPCQALADVLTMRERFGTETGKQLVFVGPGNNVTHSLMLAGPRGGFDVVVACPQALPPLQPVDRKSTRLNSSHVKN